MNLHNINLPNIQHGNGVGVDGAELGYMATGGLDEGVFNFNTNPAAMDMGMQGNMPVGNRFHGFQGVQYDGAQFHSGYGNIQASLAAVHAKISELERELAQSKTETAKIKGEVLDMEGRLSASELAFKDFKTTSHLRKRAKTSEEPGERRKRDSQAEDLVHKRCCAVVGIPYTGDRAPRNVPDPDGPNDPERRDTNGAVVLRPNWLGGLSDPSVQTFIMHVVLLLNQDEEKLEPEKQVFSVLSHSEQLHKVKTYFNSLKDSYKQQQSDEAASKAKSKAERSKRMMRLSRQADDLRKIAPKVEQALSKHFEREVAGFEQIVHTDWLDSCHSDSGNISKGEWDRAKATAGYGKVNKTWEVRKRGWVSPSLRRLYRYAQRLASTEAESAKGLAGSRVPMWKGVTANRNDEWPPMNRGKVPFDICIDSQWKLRTGSSNLQFKAHNPDEVSILGLELPDALFNKEDLDWLADDECA